MDEPTAQAPVAAPETPAEPTPAPAPEPIAPAPTTVIKERSYEQELQARIAAKQAKAAAPAEPVATAPVELAPAEPVTEPVATEPQAETPAKILPGRISTSQFSDMEKEAIAHLREMRQTDPEASIKDAYVIIEKRHEAARAAQAAQQAESEAADPLAELRQELADVDAELDKAGESETLFGKEQVKLVRLRSDLAAKLAKAEAKAEAAQELEQRESNKSENAKIATTFEKSKAEAIALYPDLADENSALGAHARAYLEEIGPDSPIRQQPDAPMIVGQQAALRRARELAVEKSISIGEALQSLGAKPVAKTAAPAAPAAPQPAKKITPATGAAPNVPVPAKPKITVGYNGKSAEEALRIRAAEIKAARNYQRPTYHL